MKKYLVVTNIWGKNTPVGKPWLLREYFKEEREYFDTKEEAYEYISLFESVCSSYEIPEVNKEKNRYKDTKKVYYIFKSKNDKAWGYILGDTERCVVLKWGGLGMYNISKHNDIRYVKDYLFRGKDEIPENYAWDIGEYEGWLQYRWGDGKNAVGYVELPKPKKEKEEIIEDEETPNEWMDEIENDFLKEEDKEKLRLLSDRW